MALEIIETPENFLEVRVPLVGHAGAALPPRESRGRRTLARVEELGEELIWASMTFRLQTPSHLLLRSCLGGQPVSVSLGGAQPSLAAFNSCACLAQQCEERGTLARLLGVPWQPGGRGWAPGEGVWPLTTLEGTQDSGPGKGGSTTAVCKARGRLSGEREHQSLLETSAVLDTYLLRDDNEINLACSHFPSK